MSSSQKVQASHILIKHEGSRRKSSWKDPEGRRISATTRDSAVAQLKTLRDDIYPVKRGSKTLLLASLTAAQPSAAAISGLLAVVRCRNDLKKLHSV